MGFRLAPRSMTLDDLELDGGRPPLLHNSGYIQHRDMMFGSRVGYFRLSLDFFPCGLHTCTVVARNPCVS